MAVLIAGVMLKVSLGDLGTPLRNWSCLHLIELKYPSVSKNVLGNKLFG